MSPLEEETRELQEVNGFRRVRGHETFVEWRDVGGEHVTEVWIEQGARGSAVWDVQYHVRDRGGPTRYLDQGTIGTFGPRKVSKAVHAAVMFMRANGSGLADTRGSAAVDPEFDFGGGL
jgi:hypothetical protein